MLSPLSFPFPMQKEAIGDLSIFNAQLRHSGRYTCTAQTVVDSASESATLTVRGNFSVLKSPAPYKPEVMTWPLQGIILLFPCNHLTIQYLTWMG